MNKFLQKVKQFFCEHDYHTVKTHDVMDYIQTNRDELIKDFHESIIEIIEISYRKQRGMIHYNTWDMLSFEYRTVVCSKCGHIECGEKILIENLIDYLSYKQERFNAKNKAKEIFKTIEKDN